MVSYCSILPSLNRIRRVHLLERLHRPSCALGCGPPFTMRRRSLLFSSQAQLPNIHGHMGFILNVSHGSFRDHVLRLARVLRHRGLTDGDDHALDNVGQLLGADIRALEERLEPCLQLVDGLDDWAGS